MNSKRISPSEKWSCPFYIKTLSHFCWEQLPQAVKYVPCELAFKLSHLWQCAFMESVNNFKCLQDKFKPIPFHPPLFLHSPTNYTFPFSFSWYITYLQNCLKKTLLFKHLKNVLLCIHMIHWFHWFFSLTCLYKFGNTNLFSPCVYCD